MKRITVTKKTKKEKLQPAIEVLKAGGLVVYPTDTVYGIAADALNVEAIGKLFVLKKRPQKPLPVIVSTITEAKRIAEIEKEHEKFVKKYWPGAITFVFEKKDIVPGALTLGLETIGVRIPDCHIAVELSRMLGRPITSTSANISGDKVGTTVDEVIRSFRNTDIGPEIYLDIGELDGQEPSTVVDLTAKSPKILREGPVRFSNK